jgi:glycosyltransferase involved in cell wall biosynthesis
MKLSVIIPMYNAGDTITQQLDALCLQQWEEPWEVIISDNGSTDESRAIAEQYSDRIPNLRIIDSSEQQGAAHARNAAAKVALGEALAFCDADDEVAPGWVAAMGQALEHHDFVAGCLDFKKLNEDWVRKTRYSFQNRPGYVDEAHFLPVVASCNMGVKRRIHEAVGGFDTSFSSAGGEDDDYSWRIQLAKTKLHFAEDALIYHRFRNTLQGIYRQASTYAVSDVLLYKKFAALGMPKPRLKGWFYIFKDIVRRTHTKHEVGQRLWDIGMKIGQLKGCLKYKVWIF